MELSDNAKAVVNAVNGSFDSAKKTVNSLIDANLSLEVREVNAIMAAFLIEDNDSRCISRYGEGHNRKYFIDFGATVPLCSVNQLHSNDLGLCFYENYIKDRDLPVDETLYGMFCAFFDLNGAWSSADAGVSFIEGKQKYFVKKLKRRIHKKCLVVMTGLGVSLGLVNNNKLSWVGLLNEIRVLLNHRVTDIIPDNAWEGAIHPEAKAQLLDQTVKKYFAHLDYRQFVSVVMRDIIPPTDHALAKAINNLQLPIATTNYDLLLDQSLRRFELNLSNAAVRFSAQHHRDFVYHVHGVWFETNSVVLSQGDYDRTQYDFEYTIGKLFFDSVANKQHRSLLFIGAKDGIVDSHFSEIYTDSRYAHLRHFALLKSADIKDLMGKPLFRNAVAAGRLIPVKYGDHHDDLLGFLQALI